MFSHSTLYPVKSFSDLVKISSADLNTFDAAMVGYGEDGEETDTVLVCLGVDQQQVITDFKYGVYLLFYINPDDGTATPPTNSGDGYSYFKPLDSVVDGEGWYMMFSSSFPPLSIVHRASGFHDNGFLKIDFPGTTDYLDTLHARQVDCNSYAPLCSLYINVNDYPEMSTAGDFYIFNDNYDPSLYNTNISNIGYTYLYFACSTGIYLFKLEMHTNLYLNESGDYQGDGRPRHCKILEATLYDYPVTPTGKVFFLSWQSSGTMIIIDGEVWKLRTDGQWEQNYTAKLTDALESITRFNGTENVSPYDTSLNYFYVVGSDASGPTNKLYRLNLVTDAWETAFTFDSNNHPWLVDLEFEGIGAGYGYDAEIEQWFIALPHIDGSGNLVVMKCFHGLASANPTVTSYTVAGNSNGNMISSGVFSAAMQNGRSPDECQFDADKPFFILNFNDQAAITSSLASEFDTNPHRIILPLGSESIIGGCMSMFLVFQKIDADGNYRYARCNVIAATNKNNPGGLEIGVHFFMDIEYLPDSTATMDTYQGTDKCLEVATIRID